MPGEPLAEFEDSLIRGFLADQKAKGLGECEAEEEELLLLEDAWEKWDA